MTAAVFSLDPQPGPHPGGAVPMPPSPADLAPADLAPTDLAPTDLAPTLRRAGAVLADGLAPLEQAMVAVGSGLMDALDGLNRVTGAFDRLPEQLDSPAVQAAGRDLEEVAATLSAIAGAVESERSALHTLADATRNVGRRALTLHKTVAAVGVLAINARIEAAHLRAGQEDFSVFSVEIGRLAKESSAAVARFVEEVGRLEALLAATAADLTEFEKAYAHRLHDAAGRLRKSLEQVGRHRQGAALAAGAIGVRSARIGEQVSSSVRSLQIGDITRQRLEHVAGALALLTDAVAPAPSGGTEAWWTALPADRRDAVVAMACRLQSAQIAHAVEDFERNIATLAGTLQALADDGRGIVRQGRALYGGDDGEKGGGDDDHDGNDGGHRGRRSFLADLARDLDVADSLIGTSRAARQRVDEAARAVERTLTGLVAQVEAVRAIETDMRLVGLNTALKCGRLGHDGRTLNVIAQELRASANRTVEDAQAVMTGLRDVVATAETLRRGEADQGAARMAGLERRVKEAIATLETADAGLGHALATLEDEGARVAALLAGTASGITVHADLGRACRAIAAELDTLAADRGAEEDIETVRAGLRSLLHTHYTMASERDLHDLLFGPADGAAGPAPAPGPGGPGSSAEAEAALDDVFF